MLLVTFHGGGKTGTKNVYCYSDSGGTPVSTAALANAPSGVLDQLRAMVVYPTSGPELFLYVVVGTPDGSVLAFSGPPWQGAAFNYLGVMIGAGESIMHPFGVTFSPAGDTCYVSNQDRNVVAQVSLSTAKSGYLAGSLGTGCQSPYLTGKYPAPKNAFLDGTFVASHVGELAKITLPDIPDVHHKDGGLNVDGSGKPIKPANSARDVTIANNILFVCDEAGSQVNMYSLSSSPTLGTFLGSASVGKCKPTHLAIQGTGIWVSADDQLYWGALPDSPQKAKLSLSEVAITVPSGNKIGGISFDTAGNVYVVFQDGTHTTGTGSIWKYSVHSDSPPKLKHGQSIVTGLPDTPEFCLWIPVGSAP
jgi:hypothetical protein